MQNFVQFNAPRSSSFEVSGNAGLLFRHLYGCSREPNEGGFSFMTSYSTFMDASGKPNGGDKWCVVAGFLSTVPRWDSFEVAWNLFLHKHSIAYLQMSSLHARTGIYKHPKWNDDQYMVDFLAEAAHIVRSHVLMWGVDLVKFEDFRKALEERPGLAEYTNAYGLCGTAVALRLQMGKIMEAFPRKLSIEHFFEEGDEGIGNIEAVFAHCNMQRPIVRPGKPHKADPERRYYVHFQAADWLAFETRKLAERESKEGRKRFRMSHKALLNGLEGVAKKWVYDDLIKFCDIKRLRGQMQ